MKNYKLNTLYFLIILISSGLLLGSQSYGTTLFTPPTHNYYRQIHFDPLDQKNWTYVGDQSINFLNNKLAFKESQFLQRATLDIDELLSLDNYGMEFTINIQQMGNAGDHTRPILMVSPRSQDSDFNNHYALTYYLETLQMGKIVANLYKVKWGLINTASPNDMIPLVESYYIMNENVDYQGRLSIENLENGHVKIDFFIDGPNDPTHLYQPLITYTDTSIYKIMESVTGPSFATVGYDDDIWGHNPLVELSNLKLYTLEAFKQRTNEFEHYAKTWISQTILGSRYNPTKFLTNQRIILTTLSGDLELSNDASIEDLLFALYAIDNGDYASVQNRYQTMQTSPLTKRLASDMLYAYYNAPPINTAYTGVLKDVPEKESGMHYVFQNGLLPLEENNTFSPEHVLTRSQLIDLLIILTNPDKKIHEASLNLPDIINNNSIFQRERPIKIWGKGLSGDTIDITFADKSYQTTVEHGKWSIELAEMKAGGPYSLTIKDSGTTKSFINIFIGEVFIIAGQSNAEMPLAETYQVNSIKSKYLNTDNIRFFFNDHLMATTPQDSANGKWYLSKEWSIDSSPAIGTYFVDHIKKMNTSLNGVKIGLVRLTYGGSTIELFMPPKEVEKMIYKQRHKDPIFSGYWNGFMDYIMPYPVKGVIYYQGENSSQLGYSYEPLLRNFIHGLRDALQSPNLPILLVQLSGYGENFYSTDNDSWPKIREVQMRVAATTENVEMVTAIDLSDSNSLEIHPKDKKPIGKRLAFHAMELIYGQKNYVKSPVVKDAKLVDGQYHLTLDFVGRGMQFKNNGLDDFEILDMQGKWHHADSKIQNPTTIIVWNTSIIEPTGIRYAWRNYPSANYFNTYNQPLLPYNSTVDLTTTDTSHLETNTFQVKSTNHQLQTFDAIENITRLNEFRMIKRIDANLIRHDFFIYGQLPGDQIRLYKRLLQVYSADGTTEEIIKIHNHDLLVGDWIRNNSREWVARRVLAVIDRNSIQVNAIPNQQSGDLIERYRYIDTITAE